MLRILLFLNLYFCAILSIHAQSCGTSEDPQQIERLRAFQKSLDNHPIVFHKSNLHYIPVKIHVVNRYDGSGGIRKDHLLQAICTLNKNFAPVGFYFVIDAPIDYINNDNLYATESDAIYSDAYSYMKQGVYNLFFTGSSSTLCGVYYPSPDAVFVIKSCAEPGASTLTHETGHFFSLPHTFSGWENGNTPSNIEYTDGRNCRNAGDGFCDTRPDYVSNRWACPYYTNLIDPANIPFKPDSSLFMSYSMDACQSRFSIEQMAAMQNNLNANRAGMEITKNELPVTSPVLTMPIHGDSIFNPNSVSFSWKKSENAMGYMIQITRYNLWDQPYISALCEDTFYTAKLFGGYTFQWRVMPISAYNTCLPYSTPDSFYLDEKTLSIQEKLIDNERIKIYPNPSQIGDYYTIELPQHANILVYNIQGQLLHENRNTLSSKIDFQASQKGIYFIQIQYKNQLKNFRLNVHD